MDWYKAWHLRTTTQILVSTVSWLSVFLYFSPSWPAVNVSFGSLTTSGRATEVITAWPNGHQCEPSAVCIKKAISAQRSSRGWALCISKLLPWSQGCSLTSAPRSSSFCHQAFLLLLHAHSGLDMWGGAWNQTVEDENKSKSFYNCRKRHTKKKIIPIINVFVQALDCPANCGLNVTVCYVCDTDTGFLSPLLSLSLFIFLLLAAT